MMMTATHDTPAPIAARLVDPQAYAEALQLREDFRWLQQFAGELAGTPRRSASNFVSGPKDAAIRFVLS
jgi:hypothetical protein